MTSDPRSVDGDALLSTAFSLYSNPGAYALLIGAGTSYASRIPVAWDVLVDLCRRAARADAVDLGEEAPETWWERTRGEEPTYGRLLEKLAKTPALRQALLEGYFEVSAEDREAGLKQPTAAHHGIARLVRAGAVRVIITLNFDRLIEQALRGAGIEPTVIAHPSEIDGMRPLHQLDCIVIHLHGDYKSPESMLNTEEELGTYAPQTQALLERILDDYGLIAAGWSAKYDPALREAMQSRYKAGRYPLAWIEPFDLTEEGGALLNLLNGLQLQTTADDAFGRLADAVDALGTRKARHPLTLPVAVATAKRELSGRTVAIAVHDTLAQEFAHLHGHPDFRYNSSTQADAVGGYLALLERIQESVRLPAGLTATLAYWGNETTDQWWLPELERFSYRMQGGGDTALLEVRRVAGLWLFYSAGIAAVLARRWGLLGRMLNTWVPHRNRYDGKREPLASLYEPGAIYHAPQYSRALFETLSPGLMEATGVGRVALEEAWQTFELLRYATQVLTADGFREACTEYWNAKTALSDADAATAILTGAGGDTERAQQKRNETWQRHGKAVGALARLTSYEHVHVLTTDPHNEDRYWVTPQAERIVMDLRATMTTHPLAQSGFTGDWGDLVAALTGVSAGLGALGRELAYSSMGGSGGVVPSSMWLDTGETMYERGSGTLPV